LVRSAALGGVLQIGDLVANDEIHSVIFYRDPLKDVTQQPDFTALLSVCDVHNVPLATNFASAEGVIHLLVEHPEALSGHHLAAGFLEDMAAKHD
jgi:methylglyoxal synthase